MTEWPYSRLLLRARFGKRSRELIEPNDKLGLAKSAAHDSIDSKHFLVLVICHPTRRRRSGPLMTSIKRISLRATSCMHPAATATRSQVRLAY
jgi:hypothetical protein